MKLKKAFAASLLIFYVVCFMGYGLSTLVHNVAHYVPNSFHHHPIGSHGHHHHVEDHNAALKNLKGLKKEESMSHSFFEVIYLFSFLIEEKAIHLYKSGIYEVIKTKLGHFAKTFQKPPPTPPPLVSAG